MQTDLDIHVNNNNNKKISNLKGQNKLIHIHSHQSIFIRHDQNVWWFESRKQEKAWKSERGRQEIEQSVMYSMFKLELFGNTIVGIRKL
jgi:hypothetical protein